jgi:hypothetical protein
MCRHCPPYIDINNPQGMQLDRFKNRTPARFEYIYCTIWNSVVVIGPLILYLLPSTKGTICNFFGTFVQVLCDKVCQWLASGRWFSPSVKLTTKGAINVLEENRGTIFRPAELHALWIINIYIGSTHAIWC